MVLALRLRLLRLAAVGTIVRGGRVVSSDVLLEAPRLVEEQGVANQSSLAEVGGLEDPEDDTSLDDFVDFSFMTSNFRYPGHKAGAVGTVSEWFGGRSVADDVKEELVQGHTCQKKGDRGQSYYATSMCYWLPEIKDEEHETNRAPLMQWMGGAYRTGKTMCKGFKGSGVCAKCSVCHNNAREAGGRVEGVYFVEKIELPEGCLGEKEIDSICVKDFDEGSPELKTEDTRCGEVKQRFLRATKELGACTLALHRLPQKIDVELVQDSQRAQGKATQKQSQLNEATRTEYNGLQKAKGACGTYISASKGWMFADGIANAQTTQEFFNVLPAYSCWIHYTGDETPVLYNHKRSLQLRCHECFDADKYLRLANKHTYNAGLELERAKKAMREVQEETAQAKKELARWREKEPGLQASKDNADKEWLPEKDSCEATFVKYSKDKASHVTACAPKMYDASCEKACIEAQEGCAVIEGDRPDSANGNGGIDVSCHPPEPSWVMAPYTYGAKEEAGGQCKRITATQKPQYAQKVLKSGWLWKKGRFRNWDKRFFVLESSDQVRSAVLRYYDLNTTENAVADESVGKGIIMWDAKQVKSKNGEQYGWKNGEECFKLIHFYREYRLCVPSDGVPVNHLGRDNSILETRDDWMNLLADEMTHAGEAKR